MRINIKVDPVWRDFWRQTYDAVIPGYHLNKQHWNTVILDGTIPDGDIRRMIAESYDLVAGGKRKAGKLPGAYPVAIFAQGAYVMIGHFGFRRPLPGIQEM